MYVVRCDRAKLFFDVLADNCGDANLPNSSNDSYYVIELRAVMASYELLKDDPESLAKFIREQQDSAQKIMKVHQL